MKKHNLLIIIICFFIVFCSSCGENSNPLTIKGITHLTKDGFYINNYVLTYEEIEKYDPEYSKRDLEGLELVIVGKLEEYEMETMSENGEIMQGREGKTTYIYDIESIEIIE